MQEEYKALMNLGNAVANYVSACKVHEEQPTEESHRVVVETAKKLLPLFRLVDSFHELDAISEGEKPDRLFAAKILESFEE